MVKRTVRMFSVAAVIVFFVAVLITPVASAAEDAKLKVLNKKIMALEKKQAELYHSLKEKKTPGLMTALSDKLSVGGAVEIEVMAEDNERDGDTSDITLATVELGIDADINDYTSAHVLFLWEEDGTDGVELDEGYLTITSPYGLVLTAGRQYLPFGLFNSHFISDPQTLELGEISETALLISYGSGPFEFSLGAFNGDINEAGEDGIHDFVASLNVTAAESVSFGISWISDLADTDSEITVAHRDALVELAGGSGLALALPLTGFSPTETGEVTDTVGAFSAYVSLTSGAFTIEAEYVGATDSFDAADYDGDLDGSGDEPEAFNLEVAYAVNEVLEVALRYEGNDDLFDVPETQYGIAASYAVLDNVYLGVEYLEGEYDNAASNNDERRLVTAQIAVEF